MPQSLVLVLFLQLHSLYTSPSLPSISLHLCLTLWVISTLLYHTTKETELTSMKTSMQISLEVENERERRGEWKGVME